MILGLDISTSIVGATVLDTDGEVVYCEAWDLRNKNKFPSLYSKAVFVKTKLWEVDDNFGIDKIFIEQSLMAFRSGFSSAKTILTLGKFNGIVSYICEDNFASPEFIGASTARKACGIKVEKGKKAKETVLNFLLDKEESFSIEYTKHGNPKPGSYDRADSYIIAKAGWKSTQS
jgi:Holliday junction resolvasome RuvABC endonuclease subunit|tara:strand:+ start:6800 stop:7321 length:522 start_codon:yes stop_codon:yes gene_type:complete